jgi:hypothetical protein
VAPESPSGLAIDPVAKRIYWANGNDSIDYASLDGSGSAELKVGGATVEGPYGVAVDPEAHRVYWANSKAGISYADTDGKGGADIPFSATLVEGSSNSPNLLQVPRQSGQPTISAGGGPGTTLSCGAEWLGDIPEARLYRAPVSTSVAWSSGGKPVAGAAGSQLAPRAVGEYACTATGSNLAGSASQVSPPTAIYKLGKVRLNRKKGTATVAVMTPGTGRLSVRGKGVRSAAVSVKAGKTSIIAVKPAGKAKKKLARTGRAKLKLSFSLAVSGGVPAVQRKSIVLRKK